MKKYIAFSLLSIMLYGCDTVPQVQYGREKYGATESDFRNQVYACMRESSSRVSQSSANTINGMNYQSSSTVQPSCQMYRACMDANGFNLVQNGRFNQRINCTNP
jgi:hypothetical protein